MTLVGGCQTVPVRYDQVEVGTWEAKALIKDKKGNQSYVVNLDIAARLNEKLRLDVTSPIGIHLASLVMRGAEVEYILVRKKKYFAGQAKPQVLSPIISVPLDPRVLHNVIFDRPIVDKNWVCTQGDEGMLSECQNLTSGLVLSFSDRVGQRKTVKIEHADANVTINFTDYEKSIGDEARLFDLQVPASFEKYRIR